MLTIYRKGGQVLPARLVGISMLAGWLCLFNQSLPRPVLLGILNSFVNCLEVPFFCDLGVTNFEFTGKIKLIPNQ